MHTAACTRRTVPHGAARRFTRRAWRHTAPHGVSHGTHGVTRRRTAFHTAPHGSACDFFPESYRPPPLFRPDFERRNPVHKGICFMSPSRVITPPPLVWARWRRKGGGYDSEFPCTFYFHLFHFVFIIIFISLILSSFHSITIVHFICLYIYFL